MRTDLKLKVALIGLGDIAQKAYLPILANHPKVYPVLCTRNNKILRFLSKKYRISSVFSNLEDLIRDRPDAAMVHSSTDSHGEIVNRLLQAGIPVFVDKPLSYSLQDVEKTLEIADKVGLPLCIGFNRRFAPLIQTISKQFNPIQITWQKHRVDLPGNPRTFIYDDFIHVVDSLRFLGKGAIKNLNVVSNMRDGKLESINAQWQQGKTLLTGNMNRVSGLTEENIEYYTRGNKWHIKELHSGSHFSDEMESKLGFSNWDSTLYKRGFVDMIEDWISVAEERTFSPTLIQDIFETHQLCERILNIALQS